MKIGFRVSLKMAWVLLASFGSIDASAQSVPTIDTEDATLGSATTGGRGRLHPVLAFDLRNGDFARGDYDDDRANLDRLPVHAQIGVAADLSRDASGHTQSWLVVRSSNGFHAPEAAESTAPRSWYESNNLVALVLTPVKGLRTAAVYTIKASPNGISATTHEASLSLAYDGDDRIGSLSPTFVVTARPKGDSGIFVQGGIRPGFDLSGGDHRIRLTVPIAVGLGAGGFYGAGSGNRTYLSMGAALERPFVVGATRWSARIEGLAIVRDDRLAASSGPSGDTGTVVPLVTMSVSMTY